MTRVVCCQLEPRFGALEENCAAAVAAVREAVAAGADVVVLPELVTCGYVFASAEEVAALAIGLDHPVFTRWAEAAGGAVVVAGFAERAEDGRLHNSAALVDASGVRAVYRKAHRWDREQLLFAAGDAPPPVVETAHGRIGVVICYDLGFPEWPRTAALAGADLLAVPTNWPRGPRPEGQPPLETAVAMAAARANIMAVACCDRTGTERGQEFSGGSVIVGADGWVVATAGDGDRASADLDLTASRDKRYTELAHLLGDRRPELYGALTVTDR